MKILNQMLLLCSIALLFVSCKKDDDVGPPTPVTYPNYSQLKVGNYWIYQRFRIDNGTETPLAIFDSIYVKNDTVIRGSTYYLVKVPPMFGFSGYQLLRDSLHYTVGGRGGILFSSVDFDSHFLDYYSTLDADTIYRRVNRMVDKDFIVNTPAGNFVTSNFREEWRFFPAYNSPVPAVYLNHRYTKNVGLVMETLIGTLIDLQHGKWVERRLVRYHVQ